MDIASGVESVRVWIAHRVVVNGVGIGEEDGAGGNDIVLVMEGGGGEAFDCKGVARAEAENFFDSGTARVNVSEQSCMLRH